MATLNIVNNFEMTSQGISVTGKQGDADDGFSTAKTVSVTGTHHTVAGVLATAAVVTVFDDDDDVPADWDYLYLWADQDVYIQIIGSGTNVVLKVEAEVPFVLSFDSMLAAADTTKITGGTEPTLTDIDAIVIGNYSGNSANFLFSVID